MITLLDTNRRVLQQHNGIKRTSYTLENLQQNRTYTLMLQARNIAGYGKSANVTVATLEAGKNIFHTAIHILIYTSVVRLHVRLLAWHSLVG